MIAPPPLVQHAGQGGLGGAIHGRDIEIEGAAPILLRAVQDRSGGHHSRAIEQNIERSRLRDHLCDHRRVPHVQPRGSAIPQACKRRLVDVRRPYRGALAREEFGCRAADPLPRRRNQGRLARQSARSPAHHCSSAYAVNPGGCAAPDRPACIQAELVYQFVGDQRPGAIVAGQV